MIGEAWKDCLPESHRKALYAALCDLVDEFGQRLPQPFPDGHVGNVLTGTAAQKQKGPLAAAPSARNLSKGRCRRVPPR